jgi:hypothetical protein
MFKAYPSERKIFARILILYICYAYPIDIRLNSATGQTWADIPLGCSAHKNSKSKRSYIMGVPPARSAAGNLAVRA